MTVVMTMVSVFSEAGQSVTVEAHAVTVIKLVAETTLVTCIMSVWTRIQARQAVCTYQSLSA